MNYVETDKKVLVETSGIGSKPVVRKVFRCVETGQLCIKSRIYFGGYAQLDWMKGWKYIEKSV